MSKRSYLVFPVIALALSLTACGGGNPSPSFSSDPSIDPSASSSASSSPTPTVEPTVLANLDSISVTGRIGEEPVVELNAPVTVEQTMTKVLIEGGANDMVVPEGGYVTIYYYGVDGTTGEVFDETWYDATATEDTTDSASPEASESASPTPTETVQKDVYPFSFGLSEVIPGFAAGLVGQKVNSRVLVGISPADAYGESGTSDGLIGPNTALFFVIDILETSVAKPEGAAGTSTSPWAAKVKVTENDKGVPSVDIPDETPPTELTVIPVIQGTGNEVFEGDIIVDNYLAYSWKNRAVVDDWTTGDVADLDATIDGLKQAIIGQKVGSRLLIIIPPDLAFPNGSNDPPVEAGDTVVFVVDILFTSAYLSAE
ncbi:MAG: FKBP-type peptidyl-prolyl cis-trans isomerase [Propionibacteriaceae bacterium]|nr:FKBP-type peptidyl-prolyl cis-trans isomerase [Propionibacteriaceae bacterium]